MSETTPPLEPKREIRFEYMATIKGGGKMVGIMDAPSKKVAEKKLRVQALEEGVELDIVKMTEIAESKKGARENATPAEEAPTEPQPKQAKEERLEDSMKAELASLQRALDFAKVKESESLIKPAEEAIKLFQSNPIDYWKNRKDFFTKELETYLTTKGKKARESERKFMVDSLNKAIRKCENVIGKLEKQEKPPEESRAKSSETSTPAVTVPENSPLPITENAESAAVPEPDASLTEKSAPGRPKKEIIRVVLSPKLTAAPTIKLPSLLPTNTPPEGGKVQAKKERIRIALPPKPTMKDTVKLPHLSPPLPRAFGQELDPEPASTPETIPTVENNLRFKYVAISEGRRQEGIIDAPNRASAEEELRKKGLLPTALKEEKKSKAEIEKEQTQKKITELEKRIEKSLRLIKGNEKKEERIVQRLEEIRKVPAVTVTEKPEPELPELKHQLALLEFNLTQAKGLKNFNRRGEIKRQIADLKPKIQQAREREERFAELNAARMVRNEMERLAEERPDNGEALGDEGEQEPIPPENSVKATKSTILSQLEKRLETERKNIPRNPIKKFFKNRKIAGLEREIKKQQQRDREWKQR